MVYQIDDDDESRKRWAAEVKPRPYEMDRQAEEKKVAKQRTKTKQQESTFFIDEIEKGAARAEREPLVKMTGRLPSVREKLARAFAQENGLRIETKDDGTFTLYDLTLRQTLEFDKKALKAGLEPGIDKTRDKIVDKNKISASLENKLLGFVEYRNKRAGETLTVECNEEPELAKVTQKALESLGTVPIEYKHAVKARTRPATVQELAIAAVAEASSKFAPHSFPISTEAMKPGRQSAFQPSKSPRTR